MKYKARFAIGTWLWLVAGLWGAPAWAESTLSLPELLAEAQRANPEIRESVAIQEMAKARIPQAGTLPDPMFGVGYRNNGLKLNLGSDPFSNLLFSISQQFPFPGKLGLRQAVARQEWRRTEAETAQQRLSVASMLTENYYELYYAYRAADITREVRDLMRRMVKISADRYAVGQGNQADLFKAQLAVAKMMQELIGLEQQQASLKAEINRLAGRPGEAPLGRPEAPVMGHHVPELATLLALADRHSARLQVAEREQRRAGAALAQAERDYYPDFTVTASIMPRGAMSAMWEIDLNMSLPVFFATRQDEAVREMAAGVRQAAARQQAERQVLAAHLADRLAKAKAALRIEDLYRTVILPQARATLRAATASYATGKVDFMTLLDSATAILNFEKDHARAVVDYHHALVHIEEQIGVPVHEE